MLMFHLGSQPWEIVVRTAIVYIAMFLGLRFLGKREIGQMTIFDLVLILLIANAVQNAMVGPDVSLEGGLIAAGVLLLMNWLVAMLRLRSPLLSRLFEGHPTVLVERGSYVTGALRRQGLDEEDVTMAMREHGIDDVSKVSLAVLETDGSISIIPTSNPPLRSRRRARSVRKRG